MHSPVIRQHTLGQLRQVLLAVVTSNPHFSPQEQLQLNHATHESGELASLTQQLHGLRYEAARRQRVAALRQQATRAEDWLVCCEAITQLAELEHVLTASGPWHAAPDRRSFRHSLRVSDPAKRVRVLGEAYRGLLEHQGLLTAQRN